MTPGEQLSALAANPTATVLGVEHRDRLIQPVDSAAEVCRVYTVTVSARLRAAGPDDWLHLG